MGKDGETTETRPSIKPGAKNHPPQNRWGRWRYLHLAVRVPWCRAVPSPVRPDFRRGPSIQIFPSFFFWLWSCVVRIPCFGHSREVVQYIVSLLLLLFLFFSSIFVFFFRCFTSDSWCSSCSRQPPGGDQEHGFMETGARRVDSMRSGQWKPLKAKFKHWLGA